MGSVSLLPSQRNDVLLAIQAAGLDPADFEWRTHTKVTGAGRTRANETIPVLWFQKSKYFFAFEYPTGGSGHAARFSPGEEHLTDHRGATTWINQLRLVDHWLEYLKREVTAPDLWGAVAEGSTLLQGATGSASENTPFTSSERERIAASLRELKDYAIATYQLTTDQTASLEGRIQYLIEASGRLSRKDWINAAVGALMGFVMTAALQGDQARDFILMTGRALNWLFQNVPLLLR
jgi:hypothetical protein